MSKLAPTLVNEANLGDVAFDGVRRRPVVAINDEGALVVCCRRTAKVNGWEVQGTMYQRARKAKVKVTAEGKLAPATEATPQRRAMDREGMTMVPKAAVNVLKAAATVIDDSVADLLAKK